MPNYDFRCDDCSGVREFNVPMEDRDKPADQCDCGGWYYRIITFRGSVWSPTRNGGHS